jgi:hypothetical protein
VRKVTFAGDKPLDRMVALLAEKPYIKEKIAERSAYKHLFRQPGILLAYLAVSTSRPEQRALTTLSGAIRGRTIFPH